jgi:3'(2'), 5'-bisphosphate nucleotidase
LFEFFVWTYGICAGFRGKRPIAAKWNVASPAKEGEAWATFWRIEMAVPKHEALCRGLLPAMVRAARLELDYFRGEFEIERKADSSPVTIADQEAENIILGALGEIAPDVPVIAEEQFSAGVRPKVDGTLFLVDALDGTRAFVKGDVDFTINVALIVDQVPVFGMILLPANGEFYVTPEPGRAARTVLSFDDDFDDGDAFARLALSDIRTREPDPGALVVSLSNSHPSTKLERQLAEKPISGRVEAGSSLKFCRVAEGRADFYPRLGSISEWDIAAGHAIVRAAGGEVTRLDGSAMAYGNGQKDYRTPPFVAWGREELKSAVHFRAE